MSSTTPKYAQTFPNNRGEHRPNECAYQVWRHDARSDARADDADAQPTKRHNTDIVDCMIWWYFYYFLFLVAESKKIENRACDRQKKNAARKTHFAREEALSRHWAQEDRPIRTPHAVYVTQYCELAQYVQ